MENLTKEQQEEWFRNDVYWKWNLFYFNKEDSRMFPPKRYQEIGATINFANKKSIVGLVLLVQVPIFAVFFLFFKK
jgi:uncharacterized membrane protein